MEAMRNCTDFAPKQGHPGKGHEYEVNDDRATKEEEEEEEEKEEEEGASNIDDTNNSAWGSASPPLLRRTMRTLSTSKEQIEELLTKTYETIEPSPSST